MRTRAFVAARRLRTAEAACLARAYPITKAGEGRGATNFAGGLPG